VKFYKLIPHNTKIDFIGKRNYTFIFSIAITILSIFALIFNGLNFGIDFRGGFAVEIRTKENVNISDLREKLNKLDVGDISLQQFGSNKDILIRMPCSDNSHSDQDVALKKVKSVLGDSVEYRKTEKIGPKIGQELVEDALIAVVVSLFAILLYVWLRFEWQFSICGVVALAHDCLVLLGLYSVLHYFEFNINSIVALLMTACYSIHDTVVIFDRIRENINTCKNIGIFELLNRSINETLSRTLLTSFTTILSLLALCFLGGKIIFDFCFPILFGLTIGTFSSIFLAAPLLVFTGIRVNGKDLKP
jgi:preprotein translocase subunit SecF